MKHLRDNPGLQPYIIDLPNGSFTVDLSAKMADLIAVAKLGQMSREHFLDWAARMFDDLQVTIVSDPKRFNA